MKALLIFLILSFFFSCNNEQKIINGHVRMVGNAPFEFLVITANKTDYRIHKDDIQKYKSLQGKKVKTFGTVKVDEWVSADNKHRFDVYTIKTDSMQVLN